MAGRQETESRLCRSAQGRIWRGRSRAPEAAMAQGSADRDEFAGAALVLARYGQEQDTAAVVADAPTESSGHPPRGEGDCAELRAAFRDQAELHARQLRFFRNARETNPMGIRAYP